MWSKCCSYDKHLSLAHLSSFALLGGVYRSIWSGEVLYPQWIGSWGMDTKGLKHSGLSLKSLDTYIFFWPVFQNNIKLSKHLRCILGFLVVLRQFPYARHCWLLFHHSSFQLVQFNKCKLNSNFLLGVILYVYSQFILSTKKFQKVLRSWESQMCPYLWIYRDIKESLYLY